MVRKLTNWQRKKAPARRERPGQGLGAAHNKKESAGGKRE